MVLCKRLNPRIFRFCGKVVTHRPARIDPISYNLGVVFFSRLQGSPRLEVFIAKAWRLESVHMASLVQRIPARGDSMCATVGREGNCGLCSAQAVWPDK